MNQADVPTPGLVPIESTVVTVTDDAVWVSNEEGYVARLDVRERYPVQRINVHRDPSWIAAGEEAVWVAVPH